MVTRVVAAAFAMFVLCALACQSIVGIDDTVVEDGGTASMSPTSSGTTSTGAAGASSSGTQGSGGSQAGAGPGGTAGCAPGTLYYPDKDQDGQGDPSGSSTCPSGPGNWVTNGDDCNDNNNVVHPGQTTYFPTGFMIGSTVSFDYDCDGVERADPAATRSQDCEAIKNLLLCMGSGFDPVMPARSGANVDPYCGSHRIRTCTKMDALTCVSVVAEDPKQTYLCH